jgi:hypothetical protein
MIELLAYLLPRRFKMYSGDEVYKGLPEKDLWKILLLGNYALRNIEI